MFVDLPAFTYPNSPGTKFGEYFNFGRKLSNISAVCNDSSPTLVNEEAFDSSIHSDLHSEYWCGLIRRIFSKPLASYDDRFDEEYQYNIVTSNTLHDLYDSNICPVPNKTSNLNMQRGGFHDHDPKSFKFVPTKYGQLMKIVHNEYLIRRTLNSNHITIAIYRIMKKLSRLKKAGGKRKRIVSAMLILLYLSFQQEVFYIRHSQLETVATLKKTLTSLKQTDDQLNRYQLRYKELAILNEKHLYDYLTNCYGPSEMSSVRQELRRTAELMIAALDSIFYKLQYTVSQLLVACNMEKLSSICHVYGVHVNDIEVIMSDAIGMFEEGNGGESMEGKRSRVQLLKKFLLCCLLSIERREYSRVSDILKGKEMKLDTIFGIDLDNNDAGTGRNSLDPCWKLRLINGALGNLNSFLLTLIGCMKEQSFVLRRALLGSDEKNFKKYGKSFEMKNSLHSVYLSLLTLERKIQILADMKREIIDNDDSDSWAGEKEGEQKEEEQISTKLSSIMELWKGTTTGYVSRGSYSCGSASRHRSSSSSDNQACIDEINTPSEHSSYSTNYKYIQRSNQADTNCARSTKASMSSGFSLDVLKPSTNHRSFNHLNERVNFITVDTEIDDFSSSDDESFKYIFPRKSPRENEWFRDKEEEREQRRLWMDFLLLSGNNREHPAKPTDSQLQDQLQNKLAELSKENKAQKYKIRTKKSLELLREQRPVRGHRRHRHGERALQDILERKSCLATEENIPLFYLQDGVGVDL